MVEMMGISHSLGSCSFPQSLRSSGEFLKTIHRMVFLTEFHPNGFDPCNSVRTKKQACFHTCSFSMVEMMGIEPTASALRTLRSPSMNVYDRKCFLSKKTLSLPAVMRRGLLIVYVYCACKILTNFTVIHCVMPFAVHCDNGSTQHRLLVFKFLIGQSSFRNLVFCIHKGRVAYPPRCRRKRAVRASLRISKN